jgi:hypothetical protein
VDSSQLLKRLTLLTKCLHTLEYALGTHEVPDDEHFVLQYYNFPSLVDLLASRIPAANGRAYLTQFVRQADTIARACARLTTEVHEAASKSGPSSHICYDFFVRAVIALCEQNGIRPTISTNRVSGERGGRFLKIAKRLELLLPPPMRSPSNEALAKRLVRSRTRIGADHPSKKTKIANSGKAPRPAQKALRFDF